MEKELVLEVIREEVVLGKQFKIYGSWDNPLFLAKDVAEMIDYSKSGNGSYNVPQMLKSIDDEEKLVSTMLVGGQNRSVSMLTEDGLYEVLMQSRKPIAKQFKKEVKKILKQIRKTGGYIPIKEEDSDLDIMVKAFSIQQKTIAEKDGIIAQSKQLIEEQSKTIAFVKMISEKGNTISMKKFADSLGIKGLGRNTLYDLLRDMKFVLPDSTEPYRKWIESGHLVSKASASKNGKLTYSTRITPKGQEYLTKKILKELDKHFIHISDEAKDYARQFIHIVGKSEEEYFAMLVKPESFRDEWEGVARFIRETTDEEEYEEDNDYDIADEIDEMLSEIE